MDYYRSNKHIPEQLYLGNKNKLRSSHFSTSKPTIVYIHGFTESTNGGEGQSTHEIRDGKHPGLNKLVFLNLLLPHLQLS